MERYAIRKLLHRVERLESWQKRVTRVADDVIRHGYSINDASPEEIAISLRELLEAVTYEP